MDKGNRKRRKAESENTKSTLSQKENLLSVFENLIRKNTDKNNADLEKYIESYQLLKEKNITSLSELKENIVILRDKNYKTTRALKDTEKKFDEKTQLIGSRHTHEQAFLETACSYARSFHENVGATC
ncbi:hypothetical protein [Alloscardovia omnicolens]|uniref:hypothetical protein n=1 Tax=Alloscardovia omnicolens TaxID=419015 RepID=UPI004057D1D9